MAAVRPTLRAIAVCALLACPIDGALAQQEGPIKIGELNSYNRWAAFTVPYRQGFELGFQEINEAGGVLGRPIEVISRDDNASPADAVRTAEELLTRENVAFLFGTFLSNVGLAVADFANQREVLFIASEPLTQALTLEQGNRFTFRMRPSTRTQTAMLVDEAAELGATRWAITAPNYEYGQAAAEAFEELMASEMPEAEVVVRQFPALGNIDAGATVAAIAREEPDAIFNALFGGDLAKFVREGEIRGLFEDRPVLSLITGEPEWLQVLGDEIPQGWIVTGYPPAKVEEPEHVAFRDAYEAEYGELPTMGALLGYIIAYTIRDMIEEAGGLERDAMIEALESIEIGTPIGPIEFRAVDNQSTFGTWVGRLAVEDGQGTLVDYEYLDAEPFLISEEEAREVRED